MRFRILRGHKPFLCFSKRSSSYFSLWKSLKFPGIARPLSIDRQEELKGKTGSAVHCGKDSKMAARVAKAARGFHGFRAFPVKWSEKNRCCGYIYFKRHSSREPNAEKPVQKTLFVVNVPPYCDEECLRRLFAGCGEVKEVYFHATPSGDVPEDSKKRFFRSGIKGYKVAYIVFLEKESVAKALNLDASEPFVFMNKDALETTSLVGIKKWCKEYNDAIPQCADLQAEVESYMAEYEEKVKKEKEEEKRKLEEAADDGWVTVGTKGRKRKRGFTRSEVNLERINQKEKKKRAKKELINFYAYQIRESKVEHITKLREKFEEDKKKIALIKASRKFKPF